MFEKKTTSIIKSSLIKAFVFGLFFFVFFVFVKADTTFLFNSNLYWNTPAGSEDVKALQQFLTTQGLYTGPITGNFMSLTLSGVEAFQTKYNITPASGYFGPITRGVANSIISSNSISLSTPQSITKSSVITDLQTKINDLLNQVSFLQNKLNSGDVYPLPEVTNVQSPVSTTVTVADIQTLPSLHESSSNLPVSSGNMQWGAYAGDSPSDLSSLESLVGKQANIQAIFLSFADGLPGVYKTTAGAKGKTLLVFWEPTSDYDSILNGSQDSNINRFVSDAKSYGYPVTLALFHEMNGNWDVWDGTVGNNTPAKFIAAWKYVHDKFAGVTNVKFALAYNSDSVPNVSGNQFDDYYPGDAYVDYVGVDGFNFGSPWQSFQSIFDGSLAKLNNYHKPIYIFSIGSAPGVAKASWITDALGVEVKKYPIRGWVWFNENKEADWRINSDSTSLSAFSAVLP